MAQLLRTQSGHSSNLQGYELGALSSRTTSHSAIVEKPIGHAQQITFG